MPIRSKSAIPMEMVEFNVKVRITQDVPKPPGQAGCTTNNGCAASCASSCTSTV